MSRERCARQNTTLHLQKHAHGALANKPECRIFSALGCPAHVVDDLAASDRRRLAQFRFGAVQSPQFAKHDSPHGIARNTP